jgi:hypothetical protein
MSIRARLKAGPGSGPHAQRGPRGGPDAAVGLEAFRRLLRLNAGLCLLAEFSVWIGADAALEVNGRPCLACMASVRRSNREPRRKRGSPLSVFGRESTFAVFTSHPPEASYPAGAVVAETCTWAVCGFEPV